MDTDWVLVCVMLLSLVFLAMIFGDKLSLLGLVDRKWISAPFEAMAGLWLQLCDDLDRAWCFVCDQSWWMLATISGALGMILTAVIMFTGFSEQAHAVRSDAESLMNVGSVLDRVPVIQPTEDDPGPFVATTRQAVYVTPSRNPLQAERIPTESTWSPLTRPPERLPQFPSAFDETELDSRTQWSFSKPRLELRMQPLVTEPLDTQSPGSDQLVQGRPLGSPFMAQVVRRAVLSLQQDNWRAASGNIPDLNLAGYNPPPLPEDSVFVVEDLERRVRVLPGQFLSESDLRIEKRIPQNPAGRFDVEIRVVNTGRQRISGLLVREFLPNNCLVTHIEPLGTYRDSVATWLLEDLDPLDEKVLLMTVTTDSGGQFESFTEVSATAAVTSPTNVTNVVNRIPGRPDVRLELVSEPADAVVGKWVEVVFNLKNTGTTVAKGVTLRVNLDDDLGHHALSEVDLERQVESKLAQLEAGDERRIVLRVRATTPGIHYATAELLLQGQQLDLESFEIQAKAQAETEPIFPAPGDAPLFSEP